MWKEVYSEKSDREKFLTKGIFFSNRTMSEEGRRGKSKKFPTLNIGYRTGIKILPRTERNIGLCDGNENVKM